MSIGKWIRKEMVLKFDFKFDEDDKVDWGIEIGWIWVCFFVISLYPAFISGIAYLISDVSKIIQYFAS